MSRFTFFNYNNVYTNSLDIYLYKLHYTLTSFSNSLENVYNLNQYLPLLTKSLLLISIFYYAMLYIYKLIGNFIANQDNSSILFDYFSEVEEEVGSLDDVLAYALVYLSVGISFFNRFFCFFLKLVAF